MIKRIFFAVYFFSFMLFSISSLAMNCFYQDQETDMPFQVCLNIQNESEKFATLSLLALSSNYSPVSVNFNLDKKSAYLKFETQVFSQSSTFCDNYTDMIIRVEINLAKYKTLQNAVQNAQVTGVERYSSDICHSHLKEIRQVTLN